MLYLSLLLYNGIKDVHKIVEINLLIVFVLK